MNKFYEALSEVIAEFIINNWDEQAHPRKPAGTSEGGQFTKQTILDDKEIELVNTDTENFKKDVDALYKGTLHFTIQPVLLSKLTTPWTKYTDLKVGSLIINQSILKKIDSLPNRFLKNHNIPRSDIERLPVFIADPLYITESANPQHADRYIAVLPLRDKQTKERISVIIQPSKDKKHAIVSAYGEKIDISEERKSKRLKYDKKLELSKRISTSSLK